MFGKGNGDHLPQDGLGLHAHALDAVDQHQRAVRHAECGGDLEKATSTRGQVR